MNIKVSRESVCLADDIYDHSKTYQLNDNATYEDLLNMLKADKYLPKIYGNNVVWVLTTKHYECIFSYFTKTNKLSMGLCEKYLKNICDSSYKMHFKYYSSPKKWKEKIYKMYNGDSYAMCRDGWNDELKYCDDLFALYTEY